MAWSISAYLFFILPAAGSVLLVYGIFQVVMTPEHDPDHRDHLHLEIGPRPSAPR